MRRLTPEAGVLDAFRVFAPGLVLLFATRAPLLSSPRLFPDGDEAVVGLMTQAFLSRGEFPGFYWGQCYGLATLESLVASVPFAVAGPTGGGLKWAALVVFTFGWWAWSLAAERIMGRTGGRIAAILLAAMPAWIAFSMKAWGGMTTAFLASGLVLMMLAPRARPSRIPAWISLAIAGSLLAATWFAQPLMAAALAPILLAREIRPRGWKKWSAFVIPALIVAWYLKSQGNCSQAHWQPRLFGEVHLRTSFPNVVRGFFVMMNGNHFMNTPLPASTICRATAAIFLLLAVVAFSHAVWRALRTRFYPFDAACAGSILLVFVLALFMKPESFMFRYLLPAAAPIALLIATRWSRLPRLAVAALFATFALLSVSSGWTMRNTSFSGWTGEEERAMRAIIQTLEARGIRHVLVTHPTLQWNLMFLSRGTIAARWIPAQDRRPQLSGEVNRALLAGERVSLVAAKTEAEGILRMLEQVRPDQPREFMAAGPLVLLGPIDPDDARALGFKLERGS
jgi:hypothetical protein